MIAAALLSGSLAKSRGGLRVRLGTDFVLFFVYIQASKRESVVSLNVGFLIGQFILPFLLY